jgi:hypothetical protein
VKGYRRKRSWSLYSSSGQSLGEKGEPAPMHSAPHHSLDVVASATVLLTAFPPPPGGMVEEVTRAIARLPGVYRYGPRFGAALARGIGVETRARSTTS